MVLFGLIVVFSTKEEMFKELKANKEKIISLKKSAIKTSQPFESNPSRAIKADGLDKDFIYPVINTTNIQDQHQDIHLKGIWNKSAKEQQGKVHYLINHKNEIGSVIAFPKDVEMQVTEMKFSDLGENFEGTTEALIFKTNVFDYSNKDATNIINNKMPIQKSISMQYLKIEMGVNSTEKDFKEEKAVWDKYYNEVANKDTLNENGHGFFVSEAKIHREGSMVLAGSNHVTPILYPEEKSLESIKGLVSEEIYIALQSALETKEAVSLTLHNKVEPQKHKSIFEIMAKKA